MKKIGKVFQKGDLWGKISFWMLFFPGLTALATVVLHSYPEGPFEYPFSLKRYHKSQSVKRIQKACPQDSSTHCTYWQMLPMDPDLPLLCIEDLELRRCKADENVRLRKECPLSFAVSHVFIQDAGSKLGAPWW